VRRIGWAVVAVLGLVSLARAGVLDLPRPFELDRVNRGLAGRLVDHTHNHGADHRIWSEALGEKRDLYVYLPPGYDPCKRYPLLLWLHGLTQDEKCFLNDGVGPIDRAVRDGRLPPLIVAAPDGSIGGVGSYFNACSGFLNTPVAGRYEDFLMQDVWDFLMTHYSIRPEPEAHAVAGVSMGGGAAFHTAIKYQDRFKTVLGFCPLLNLRWVDRQGHYLSKFDPNNWGWRTDFGNGRELLGCYFHCLAVRQGRLVDPLYGHDNPDTLALVSRDNPIEMLDAYDVRDGQLNMYIAYVGKHDEINVDTQVESFLYHAHERGLHVTTDFNPLGHHNKPGVLPMLPRALAWIGDKLAPYAPQ